MWYHTSLSKLQRLAVRTVAVVDRKFVRSFFLWTDCLNSPEGRVGIIHHSIQCMDGWLRIWVDMTHFYFYWLVVVALYLFGMNDIIFGTIPSSDIKAKPSS